MIKRRVVELQHPDGGKAWAVIGSRGEYDRLPNGKVFTRSRKEALAFAKGRSKRARIREKRKWGGTYGGSPLGM
jgi:hypothetical protein